MRVFYSVFSALVFLVVAAVAPRAYAKVPQFVDGVPDTAEAGHVTLAWQGADLKAGDVYQLEHATTPDFSDARRILDGKDQSSFVSGLPNGPHYFRVRIRAKNGQAGAWSKPHQVTVKHQSLALSFGLFSTGAVVFVLTVLFVSTKGFRNGSESES